MSVLDRVPVLPFPELARANDLVVVTAVAAPIGPDLLGEVERWAARHGDVLDTRVRRGDGVVLLRMQIRTPRPAQVVCADFVAAFASVLLSWRVRPILGQRVLLLAGRSTQVADDLLTQGTQRELGGDVVLVAGAHHRVAALARWWSTPYEPITGTPARVLPRLAELHLVDLVVDVGSGLLSTSRARDALERRGIPAIGLHLSAARACVRYATGAADGDIATGPAEHAALLLAAVVRAHCAGELVAAEAGTWRL